VHIEKHLATKIVKTAIPNPYLTFEPNNTTTWHPMAEASWGTPSHDGVSEWEVFRRCSQEEDIYRKECIL
jgi:hypothetical protein